MVVFRDVGTVEPTTEILSRERGTNPVKIADVGVPY
jgi:hypothetical protein